jgi:hypothetical protein
MSNLTELEIFRCARKGCDFATRQPFNFCPMCGSVIYLYKADRAIEPTIGLISDSACTMSYKCVGIELYDEQCEKLELRHKCVIGLWTQVEALEREIRTMRLAFQDAGLQIPPRPESDLSSRPIQESDNERHEK